VSLMPTGGIGYKDLDLQVTKNFMMPRGQMFYLRADWLNVFNTFNPDGNGNGYSLDYGNWDGAPLARPTANRLGNILGTPATFKLSVGYRF